jgi:hypothetical protein
MCRREKVSFVPDPEAMLVLTGELHSQATPALVVGRITVIGFDSPRYEAALSSPRS